MYGKWLATVSARLGGLNLELLTALAPTGRYLPAFLPPPTQPWVELAAELGHQSCLAHLLCRYRQLVADADRGQARTPHAVRRILQHALALRDAHDAGAVDAITLVAEADRLGAQIDNLVAGTTCYPPNRRLLNHLAAERVHLFMFLRVPGVQTTNWRAEQAIRPAVVTRKSWGGNRTWTGAEIWLVLTSVLRTAIQQARDPVELLTSLLQAPTPIVSDLAIPGR